MVKAAVLATLASTAQAAHWAVLVAGSNSYSNYRHQADVCHSYQVVKSKGIPDENIIVLAYDDIANNSRNPFPGQLFNKPTAAGEPGVDVYAGCKIDYKGADVTPQTFEQVMTGTASGKKLESTADDNVFVFFSDHGAAGLIAFPSSQMHKAEFQQMFDTMAEKKMFNKLTFYLETCESGSMFEGMSTPGVYGLSAASPSESSWGTYCGSDAMVNGKSVGSCLGDLFSVKWMEDSDAVDITSESLNDQFGKVKTATTKSAVMQWGDLTFQDDMVSEYQGAATEAAVRAKTEAEAMSVSARQVDLKQAYDNYINAESGAARVAAGEELQTVISEQIAVEQAYENFLHIVYPDESDKRQAARDEKEPANQYECEMAARKSFVENGKFNSFTGFSLQFQQRVVNVCADLAKTGMNIDVAEAAKQACTGATLSAGSVGGTLAVTWDDCGAQHATVTDLQPTSIATGETVTLTGTGTVDEDVTSAHFAATVKAAGVKLTECDGDATADIECKLPLGAGKIVVKKVSYPLAAGNVAIPVVVSTASLIPASLAKVDVEIRATEQNGEDVICLNVHTAKQAVVV